MKHSRKTNVKWEFHIFYLKEKKPLEKLIRSLSIDLNSKEVEEDLEDQNLIFDKSHKIEKFGKTKGQLAKICARISWAQTRQLTKHWVDKTKKKTVCGLKVDTENFKKKKDTL